MGNNGDFFMRVIKCPSIRARKVKGKFNPSGECNHILGFFPSIPHKSVRQCPSCKSWYLIKIEKNIEDSTIDLVEKQDLDFSKVLTTKVIKRKIL